MQVIDLTNHKEPVRVLQNALEPNINAPGTFIIYHEGSYVDTVHNTPVGRAAWALHEQGKVLLCQKRIGDEPRRYAYMAVVR